VIVTITGSRSNQPNKCEAVVVVPDGYQSITYLGHRIGASALKQDQFMKDVLSKESYIDETRLLPPFLDEFVELIALFKKQFGEPTEGDQRRTMTIMVLNEGVIDIFLNFMCSVRGSTIDSSNFIVFVGNTDYIGLIESLGAKTFYHPKLGKMPRNAAQFYLDDTFKQMVLLNTLNRFTLK
jgi:hypothetical protein